VIDLHTHVLPGLDDGPPTLDAAVELAHAVADSGVKTVVATPHVSFDYPRTQPEIAAAADQLRAALREAGIELEVVTGAEVELSYVFDRDDSELTALHLGGGPYLLVESPLSAAAGDFDPMLLTLQVRGHRVVLAHPERCPAFMRRPERLEKLVEAGMLCSITAGSMAGRFGRTVRRFTLDLLRRGLVHDVSSDTHDLVRRPPGLLEGFEAAERDLRGLADQLERLTAEAPAAILAGDLPPAPRELKSRRRLALRRA
jgi:protein-tyrosine phosphatase